MDVRVALNELIGIQDTITHLNCHAPPLDSDQTALQEFRQDISGSQMYRDALINEIVTNFIVLEEKVKRLDFKPVSDECLFCGNMVPAHYNVCCECLDQEIENHRTSHIHETFRQQWEK